MWCSFKNVLSTKLLKHLVKRATSSEHQEVPKEKDLSRIASMIDNDKGGYLAFRCAELLLKCKNKHKKALTRVKSNLVVHSLMHRSKKFCDSLGNFEDVFKQPCQLQGRTECIRGVHFQFLGLKAKQYSQGVIRQSTFPTSGLQTKNRINLVCLGETSWVVLDAVEGQIDLIISFDRFIRDQIANEKKRGKRGNSGNTELPLLESVIRSIWGSQPTNYSTFTDHPLMQEIFRLMAIEFYSLVVLYESLISKFSKEFFEANLTTCRRFFARYVEYLDRIECMKRFRETLVEKTLLPASQIFEFGLSVNLLPALEAHLNKLTYGERNVSIPSPPVVHSLGNNKTLFFPPDTIERYVDAWPEPPIARHVPHEVYQRYELPVDSTLEEENINSTPPSNDSFHDFTEVDLSDPPLVDLEQESSPFLGNQSTDLHYENLPETLPFQSAKPPDETDA